MDYELDGDDEIEGADVMGMDVVGWTDDGAPIVVGARRRRRGRRGAAQAHGQTLVPVQRPGWRAGQLAPGVVAPDQGLLPLPLTGSTGTDTFTATLATITFQGRLQKPFRGERLLVSAVRTGASAVGRIRGQLFVGTDLQQVQIQGFDIEQVGSPTAFGVRLTMTPAQPGVDISLVTTLNPALTGTDTILVTITLLGRVVH
jgi:hypothetical protein